MNCENCKFNKYKNLINPSGSEKAEIYLLLEQPSHISNILISAFTEIGYNIENCRINYAIACKTKDKITDKIIDCCRNHILEDIDKVKPKVIITFGINALKSLFDGHKVDVGINSLRGRSFIWHDKNCWVCPTLNPFDVLKLQNWNGCDKFFKKDIQNAINNRKIILPEKPKYDIISLTNFDEICEILKELKNYPFFSWDIETSHKRPFYDNAKILSISFSMDGKTGFSLPISYRNFWTKEQETILINLLKDILNNPNSTKINWNLIFEYEWIKTIFGIDIQGNLEDGMLQAYILDCRNKTHSLGFKGWELFGLEWKNEIEKYKNNMEECPSELLLSYNAEDSIITYLIWEKQKNQIKTELQKNLYKNILIPIAKNIAKIQIEGVLVDKNKIEELKQKYTEKVKVIQTELFQTDAIKQFQKQFGMLPKVNSNCKDLSIIFFDIMKLEPIQITDKGNKSQDAEFLNFYAEKDNNFCKTLLEYREYNNLISKLNNTFTENIFSDKKYHSSFNLTFTVSGRLSSQNVNLQNINKQKHLEMRDIIIAPERYVILSLDFAQLEARNIAMISGDENFIKIIKSGYDIHLEKAKELFGKQMNDKSRFNAKNSFVFPSFYGASYKSCAKNLGLPENIVKKVQDKLWIQFPKIKQWHKQLKKFYDLNGYVESVTGRRRYGPISYNEMINHPIQSVASDIVVTAMNELKKKEYNVVINIHDELVFYISENKIKESYLEIKQIMENIRFDWMKDVPLQVEGKIGYSWGNLVKIEEIL